MRQATVENFHVMPKSLAHAHDAWAGDDIESWTAPRGRGTASRDQIAHDGGVAAQQEQ